MRTKEEILNDCHRESSKVLAAISTCHFPLAYKDAALNAMDEYALEFLESFRDFQREYRSKEDPNGFGQTDDYIYQEFMKQASPSHKPAQ